MNLTLLAADIAARVPAMAQDCAINNAAMIEGLIRNEMEEKKQLEDGRLVRELVAFCFAGLLIGFLIGISL